MLSTSLPTDNASPPSAQYRGDVQALRGVAVLLVVVFHAWPGVAPGGFVGVDVFFVISGYLITALLLRELESYGRIDFLAFYARRIRRLLPAAALVIATTVLAATVWLPSFESTQLASTAVAAALYLSNLWFAVLSVDYLQEGLHRNLLLHTWSLGVEEQFYLVWPALLAASAAALPRWPLRRALAWVIAGLSLLSLAACVVVTARAQSWAFFGLPTRAWELGAGALALLAERRLAIAGRSARAGMVVAGLVCIAVAALAFGARTRFPGFAALLPVLGAFLVIAAGSREGSCGPALQGALRAVPLQRLGDLSYSLYLWHWPVLIVLADAWPGHRQVAAGVGIAISLSLAAWTYRFVETPIRRHPRLQTRPLKTMAMGLALVVVSAALALASRFAMPAASKTDPRARAERAVRDTPRLYRDKCFAAAADTEPPECVYGSARASHTVVLVGDSHAAQWFPTLEALAQAKGWRLLVFVKAACPLAAVEPFDPKLNRPYLECTQWRDQVLQRIARARPTLVVAATSSFYQPFVTGDAEAIEQWRRGLGQTLDSLSSTAAHVTLIRDTPWPGFHVPRCLASPARSGSTGPQACTFARSSPVSARAYELERVAIGGRAAASMVDLSTSICPAPTCTAEREGVVLFHDAQHLSASFAQSLAEPFWQQLPVPVRDALTK